MRTLKPPRPRLSGAPGSLAKTYALSLIYGISPSKIWKLATISKKKTKALSRCKTKEDLRPHKNTLISNELSKI